MTGAFESGMLFNPMRFREEIKILDLSTTRLELLLQQYKTCFGFKGHETLSEKIREEVICLKNIWRDLESKLKEVEKEEVPYYFVKEQTKRKIAWLLDKSSELLKEPFL